MGLEDLKKCWPFK